MNINQTELQIMKVLWAKGEMPLSQLCCILQETSDWKKTTIYTMVSRCVKKGYIQRIDPNFICRPLISKEEVEKTKITDILHNFFGDSKMNFMSAFLKNEQLTEEEIQKLKDLIEQMK